MLEMAWANGHRRQLCLNLFPFPHPKKAVASMGEWTFFNISASSLMSKWVGDG